MHSLFFGSLKFKNKWKTKNVNYVNKHVVLTIKCTHSSRQYPRRKTGHETWLSKPSLQELIACPVDSWKYNEQNMTDAITYNYLLILLSLAPKSFPTFKFLPSFYLLTNVNSNFIAKWIPVLFLEVHLNIVGLSFQTHCLAFKSPIQFRGQVWWQWLHQWRRQRIFHSGVLSMLY